MVNSRVTCQRTALSLVRIVYRALFILAGLVGSVFDRPRLRQDVDSITDVMKTTYFRHCFHVSDFYFRFWSQSAGRVVKTGSSQEVEITQ